MEQFNAKTHGTDDKSMLRQVVIEGQKETESNNEIANLMRIKTAITNVLPIVKPTDFGHGTFSYARLWLADRELADIEPHKRAGYLDSMVAEYFQSGKTLGGFGRELAAIIEKSLPSSERGQAQKQGFAGAINKLDPHRDLRKEAEEVLAMIEGKISVALSIDSVRDTTRDAVRQLFPAF